MATVADSAIGMILARRLVWPLFQPIVDLSTRAVVGLEALARGPEGTALHYPDALFQAAREAGRLGALDLLCAERALECAVQSPAPPPLLFVNAEPAVLDQPLSPRLIELVQDGLPFREVLEFTERALPAAPGSLLRIAAQTRGWGNAVALDDVGVDPVSLAFLPLLDPQVIKLDLSLVRNPAAAHSRAVAATVGAQARRTGAVVVAEGIETEDDLHAAKALGARWGQGWLFGRPGPITVDHRYDVDAASCLPAPAPGFHQPVGRPFDVAVVSRRPRPAGDHDITTALTRVREIGRGDGAVVVAYPGESAPAGHAAAVHELLSTGSTVTPADRPAAGEFAAVAFGPGRGFALCTRMVDGTPQLVVEDCPVAVAAITRAMLHPSSR